MASANPFWFGYYPGDKPLVKRPPKVFPGPILDYSRVAPEQVAVALDMYLDEVVAGVKDTMLLPKWLHEKVIDDWKKSFTASAIGYTPSGSSTFEFEGAEGADIPGVQVSINLYDLVKSPEKTLQKFIDKQVLSGIDPRRSEFWTDLDTALTKRLYTDIVKGEGGLVEVAMRTTNKDPISFKDQKVYAQAKVYSSDEAGLGRLRPATDMMTEGETDVYAKAGESFTGFVMNQKSTAKRGRAYTGLQSSFIKAAATEIEQKKAQIVTMSGMGGLALLEADRAERMIGTFLDEAKVVEELGEFNVRFTANFGVAGSLSKKAFAGLEWGRRYANSDAAKLAGDTGAYASISQIESIKKNADTLRNEITKVRGGIADYKTNVLARSTALGITGADAKRYREKLQDFDKRVAPIEDIFARAEHLCTRIDSMVASKDISRLELESLIREQTAIASQMSHQRYGGGVFNQYVIAVSREYFERDDFGRNKYFTHTDPVTGAPIMSQGFRSLDPIYRYSKGQYFRQDGEDLIEAVIAGKYFERRYWYGRWRNTIQAFTPSYWTTKVLKRMSYFGLVYDEDDELSLFLNKDQSGEDRKYNWVSNAILRPFTRKHSFNASFDVSVAGASFKSGGRFEGGLYLGYLNKAWVRASQDKLVGVVSNTGNWTRIGTASEQKRGLIDLLNGDTVSFENATGLAYQMSGIAGGLDFNNAKKGAEIFRNKVLKNKGRVRSLGLELDASGKIIQNDKNRAILDGFFGKLGEMDKDPGGVISPFLAKVGLFNWMSAKLTKIQALEAKLLAPFIKPFIILREGLKNLAGKLFRTALYVILGTFTGGTGAFLMKKLGPFLEKVFNATMARFMRYFSDGVTKAFKALLKGDIDKAFEAMAEGAAKMIAWAMACGCSIPILLMLLVALIMSPILSSISPVDRSKAPSSSSSSGPVVPPPPVDPDAVCLLPARALALSSFSSPASGHGSTWYWTNDMPRPKPAACIGPYQPGITVFSIPYYTPAGSGFACPGYSCSPLNEATAYCPGMATKTGFYGFASDYTGTGAVVYAPKKMCNATVTGKWKITGSTLINGLASRSSECGVLMETNSGGSLLQLFLIHLDNCAPNVGRKLSPGDAITTLFPGAVGGVHVHAEMMKDGVPVKPESCVCI